MTTCKTLDIIPFHKRLNSTLNKQKITVLQINLGRRCNLACNHCHVEASPKRTEEVAADVGEKIMELINRFPQIETVDLTGGAPEIHEYFKPIVEAARVANKNVIVRSNLTIFFESGFENLPQYFANHQLRIVASLPCYLEDNVDKQRGSGVYEASIRALQRLNQLGYGCDPNLQIDLVYNPPIPRSDDFNLTPSQVKLEQDYKQYLKEQFNIAFNHLFTITNLPIGRTKKYLQDKFLYTPYLSFLANHHNSDTLDYLMCRNQLSIDYLGNVYDCDFNQMENIPAKTATGEVITVTKLLTENQLDMIETVQTADYCYGCTAGSGSSCGGALIDTIKSETNSSF